MIPISPIRGILPPVNIKSIILNPPGQVADADSLTDSLFVNASDRNLNIQVKTTSITTSNNETNSIAMMSAPAGMPSKLNFNNHLRVCVIQSRNADLTKVLRGMGDDVGEYLGPLNQWKGNHRFDDMIYSNILKKLGIPKKQTPMWKSNFMKIQTKKLFGDIKSPLTEKKDDTGKIIKSIPLNFNFTIDQYNPVHLCYFAVPYIDWDGVASDHQKGIGNTAYGESSSPMRTLRGADYERIGAFSVPLKYDVVFKSGKISGKSFFYKTRQGEVWTGPVHRMSDGKYMTENAHTVASKYLTLTETNNVKVQDFRTSDGIKSIGIMNDFQDEQQTITNILKGLQARDRGLNSLGNSRDSYVSDLFISAGVRKSGKFMFLINMDDLISTNSLFGSLIKTSDLNLRDKVFDNSAVKSLKIYRHVVEEVVGTNAVGTATPKFLVKNVAPVLVVATAQREGTKSLKARTNFIEEGNMSFSSVGIKAFNMSDRNFSSADRGKYQYTLEIEIVDRTIDYLRNEVKKIRRFISVLQNYESDMLNSVIRPKERGNNPYVRDGDKALSRTRAIGGFDFRFGNLTPNFAKKMKKKYGASIKEGNMAFIELLKIFTKDEDFTAPQQTNLDNFLGLVTSPNTTNPSNVNSLIRLLQDSTSKISDFIGSNVRMTDPVEKKAEQVWQSGETVFSSYGAIKIEKKFKNILDLSKHGKGGYDYLSGDTGKSDHDSGNQSGLRTLAGREYRSRVVREILKYFTNTQPNLTQGLSGRRTKHAGGDSAQNTGFSFLTPAIIRFNEIPIDVLNSERVENPLLTRLIESKLVMNTVTSMVNGGLPPYDREFRGNTFLAARQNPGAAQVAPTEQRNFLSQKYNFLPTAPPQLSLSDSNFPGAAPAPAPRSIFEQARINASVADLPSQYPASFIERIFKRCINKSSVSDSAVSRQENISLFDLNENNNFLQGVEQTRVADLPNQIKALFISISTGNGGDVVFRPQIRKDVFNDPDQAASATLKYKLITEVQYLNAFSTTSVSTSNRQKLLMTAPNFSRLTADAFSEFTGKKILCRLRKFEIPEWGITRPPLLDVQIYDEYFIIQPDAPATGATRKPGMAAALSAAGWGLSAEEYALLSEFGTSFLPIIDPVLESDAMKNVAAKIKSFGPAAEPSEIADTFDPPAEPVWPQIAEMRQRLRDLNVIISGMEQEKSALASTRTTQTQKLTEIQTQLNNIPQGEG